ncbi:MAG: ABC transporter ATP-binding protein [Thermodesulfovibrionales bacterium]
MKAIEILNLSKTFKGKKGIKVEALKALSLDIKQGEIFGFLGPNGAGKSTTIKLLMGLIYPTSGKFYVNGIEGTSLEYKKVVGYLPENPSFYDYLTGEELLYFVGKIFSMSNKEISEGSDRLLRLLDLYDARTRPVRNYSKGMVQRLGLAQCLLHDPDIFILDEPMSGLDPLGRMLVRDIILDLKAKGKCVFMSTHILNDIETICDRVGIIVKGELRLVESIKNIMARGIKGYLLTFNAISGHMSNRLKSISEDADRKNDSLSFHIKQKDIESVLSGLSGDKETSIQLIEPVRKGLEELFTEIVHED